jgi:type IV pilus assembly protein PilX
MLLIHSLPGRNHQRGVALVMAMVFLLLLTILGVTSMSTSSLEEKMSTNTRDRNLAFQSAETALVAAETWISSLGADPATWPEPAAGKYIATVPTPIWDTVDWGGAEVVSYPCTPTDATPDDSASCVGGVRAEIPNVNTQPKYIIEHMGQAANATQIAYRITARGTGSTDAAVVVLQSTFIKQY